MLCFTMQLNGLERKKDWFMSQWSMEGGPKCMRHRETSNWTKGVLLYKPNIKCECKIKISIHLSIAWNIYKYMYIFQQSIDVALIRSRLDGGSMVYGSTAKTVFLELDVIHSRALRICLGKVQNGTGVCVLFNWGRRKRKRLMVNNWVNLKCQKESHPTKRVLGES